MLLWAYTTNESDSSEGEAVLAGSSQKRPRTVEPGHIRGYFQRPDRATGRLTADVALTGGPTPQPGARAGGQLGPRAFRSVGRRVSQRSAGAKLR